VELHEMQRLSLSALLIEGNMQVFAYKRINRLKWQLAIAAALLLALFAGSGSGSGAYADYTRVSSSVNLRKSPTLDAKVLKLVPMGYEVTVEGKDGEWTKVSFEGATGYVKTQYLELIKSAIKSATKPASGSAPNSAPAAASGGEAASGAALKQGDEGDGVKELQSLLTQCGAYSGPINSKFGPLTEAAVTRFQEDAGLDVDGIAGNATIAAIKAKLAAARPAAYRNGDEGDAVTDIQKALKAKGFYSGPVNGRLGPLTEKALKAFQGAWGLEVDGVAGRATLELLFSAKEPASSPQPSEPSASGNAPERRALASGTGTGSGSGAAETAAGRAPAPNGVELLSWSDVKEIMTVGGTASVYDVRSGTIYHVKSFSNGNHADVEPVTKEDTALLKQTYGGTWSWDPRPVWVTINGRTIAASTNGMPHAGGVNGGNGMDGQICIHFLGSSTHNGNKDYAQLHQDAVNEAWEAATKGAAR
jgi:peptidoglycan hydrolase-like protein with peptidoglycan-binding domain